MIICLEPSGINGRKKCAKNATKGVAVLKGSTIVDPGGRGKIGNDFFFLLANAFLNIFFSWRRTIQIFFPGKGLFKIFFLERALLN